MQLNRRQAMVVWGGAAVLGASWSSHPAFAQFRVEVAGIGAQLLPIVCVPFKGEEVAPQKVAAIVAADLARSGVFKPVEPAAALAQADDGTRPDWVSVRASGADLVLLGGLYRLADGRYDLRCRLWDAVRGLEVGALALTVSAADLRHTAHRIADWIYAKLTAEPGAAATRVAYVTKVGRGSTQKFNLWVADSDGENASSALASSEPIISPAWSPDGKQLAYVSFESGKPVVYAHEVASAKRRVLANFKGSNSAPAWSPDGGSLVVTLSRDGGSQMFLLAGSGQAEPRKLSSSLSIETEAAFAPDGQSIYFVSDRGGAPQIYRMSLSGATVQRVTFMGSYNISPAISPKGDKLAYISRVSGVFKLMVQDLASGAVNALTDTQADEKPSFSPNGKQIIYATQINTAGRWQEALMVTSIDGRVKSKLTAVSGDIREPSWSTWLAQPLK